MTEILSGLKGIEFYEQKVSLKSALTDAQMDDLEALAQAIADDIKAE
jgi:hypothetical protein